MKVCSRCKEEKSSELFYKKKLKDKHIDQSFCKECFNKYCIQRWIDRKKEAVKLFGGSCFRCGYSKYYGALEFHHINKNEKSFSWNKSRLLSKEKMINELKKCVLLCANCHREEESEIRNAGRPETGLLNQ